MGVSENQGARNGSAKASNKSQKQVGEAQSGEQKQGGEQKVRQ
jgi:hypothetical protein